jgi:hypothetical protein
VFLTSLRQLDQGLLLRSHAPRLLHALAVRSASFFHVMMKKRFKIWKAKLRHHNVLPPPVLEILQGTSPREPRDNFDRSV